MKVLAADIGGTNVRAALIVEHGAGAGQRAIADVQRMSPRRRGEPLAVDGFVDFLDGVMRSREGGEKIEAVGISIAGIVDDSRTTVRKALNVGWQDVCIAEIVSRRLHLPCVVDSDAFCGAYAEGRFGAGAGRSSFLFVTLGTGIGHALVAGGGVIRGSRGAANVFGHLNAVPDGVPCYCGNRGCLCQYSSGEGIARMATLRFSQEMKGQSAAHVFKSARAGEAWAREVLAEASRMLARALSFAFTIVDVESAVLGGGIVSPSWPDIPALQEMVAEMTHPEIRPITVCRAAAGPDAMLLGAALAANELFKEDTTREKTDSRG